MIAATIKNLLFIISILLFFQESHSPKKEGYFKPDYLAYQPGEKLRYRIHYGMIDAATATFKVGDTLINIGGDAHYYFSVFGRTLSHWDWFYKVRDYYYSFVDTSSLLPTFAYRKVHEGDYQTREEITFKRQENKVLSKGKTTQVPENIHDIISAIYYARCIDFSKVQVGTYVPINTFFADSLFPVGLTYKGKENIRTQLGKFRARVFKPHLVEGRIFKGQDDMTVYVSDDRNQVPLRIESKVFVGSIQADLKEFEKLKFPLDCRVE